VDVTRGEIIESELDRLITKRHDRRVAEEGERPALEAWQESEMRYEANRWQAIQAAWYVFHMDQAERHRRTLEGLVALHEAAAAKLCEEPAP
jgi:hypothetical protein